VFRFDSLYLDWLQQGDRWFGIQVADGDGQLVGCELALWREILWDGRPLRGYYVTLLSVDPAHRGRGLAQRILRHLIDEALVRREVDMLVSSFDAGAAGRPTVEKAVAKAAGQVAIRLSRPLSLWACAANLREADRYEPLRGLARAALWPGISSLVAFSGSACPSGIRVAPGCLEEPGVDPAPGHGFRFRLESDLGSMYHCRADGRAGTLRLGFGNREEVTIAWHVSALTKPSLPDQSLGMVQFVLAKNTSGHNLARALRYVNHHLLRQGCRATTILNAGVAPCVALWQAGFRPTSRRIQFSVRGRADTLNRFRKFDCPFQVDLL